MGWLILGMAMLTAGVWTGIALANLIRSFTDIHDVWEDDE